MIDIIDRFGLNTGSIAIHRVFEPCLQVGTTCYSKFPPPSAHVLERVLRSANGRPTLTFPAAKLLSRSHTSYDERLGALGKSHIQSRRDTQTNFPDEATKLPRTTTDIPKEINGFIFKLESEWCELDVVEEPILCGIQLCTSRTEKWRKNLMKEEEERGKKKDMFVGQSAAMKLIPATAKPSEAELKRFMEEVRNIWLLGRSRRNLAETIADCLPEASEVEFSSEEVSSDYSSVFSAADKELDCNQYHFENTIDDIYLGTASTSEVCDDEGRRLSSAEIEADWESYLFSLKDNDVYVVAQSTTNESFEDTVHVPSTKPTSPGSTLQPETNSQLQISEDLLEIACATALPVDLFELACSVSLPSEDDFSSLSSVDADCAAYNKQLLPRALLPKQLSPPIAYHKREFTKFHDDKNLRNPPSYKRRRIDVHAASRQNTSKRTAEFEDTFNTGVSIKTKNSIMVLLPSHPTWRRSCRVCGRCFPTFHQLIDHLRLLRHFSDSVESCWDKELSFPIVTDGRHFFAEELKERRSSDPSFDTVATDNRELGHVRSRELRSRRSESTISLRSTGSGRISKELPEYDSPRLTSWLSTSSNSLLNEPHSREPPPLRTMPSHRRTSSAWHFLRRHHHQHGEVSDEHLSSASDHAVPLKEELKKRRNGVPGHKGAKDAVSGKSPKRAFSAGVEKAMGRVKQVERRLGLGRGVAERD